MAATANFLAIDRGDICAEELTHHMATPTADWEKVVRLGRYLKNRPRVQLRKRRANLKHIQTQIGKVAEEHAAVPQEDTQLQGLIHQNVVQNTNCCSAEAESYGFVRASAETMGLKSMYKDLNTPMNGLVLGNASAALAIMARRGLGKLWHLDTNYLWIQEKAAKGDLNFKNVVGVDNGAALFAKTLSWNEIQGHIHKLSSQFV